MSAVFPSFELEQLKVLTTWRDPVNLYFEPKELRLQCWVDRPLLAAAVSPLKSLFVVDAASDEYFADVRRQIDSGLDGRGRRVIHVAGRGSLLKELLQLGADPDVLNSTGSTSSEICSFSGFKDGAEVIIKCRPDLTLVSSNENRRDQLQYAMCLASRKGRQQNVAIGEVAEVWRKTIKKDGFPSLAQLAHDQDWYAVHNLCRRRVVGQEEKNELYQGKTALDWARFHGRDKVAEELVYLLEMIPNNKVPEPAAAVEQCNREMEELKEMFLLTISKTNEKYEDLEREIAVLKSENEALRKQVKHLEDEAPSSSITEYPGRN